MTINQAQTEANAVIGSKYHIVIDRPIGSVVHRVYVRLYRLTEQDRDLLGTWSYVTPALGTGVQEISAVAEDAAGNLSGVSGVFEVRIAEDDPLA